MSYISRFLSVSQSQKAYILTIQENLIEKFKENSSFQCFKTLLSQPAFTCSKLTMEALEQGVKYVQS